MKKHKLNYYIYTIMLCTPLPVYAAGGKNAAQAIMYAVGKCAQMFSYIPISISVVGLFMQQCHKVDDAKVKMNFIKLFGFGIALYALLPALEAGGFA